MVSRFLSVISLKTFPLMLKGNDFLHLTFINFHLQIFSLLQTLFFFLIFIYLFIFGCVGSSFLCEGFLQLRRAGATPHRGARASHHRSLSCCGAQAPDAQAQQLWLTGPFAPRHVGSSQTRARTCVPCIGRQTLNHHTAREALLQTLNERKNHFRYIHNFEYLRLP